MSNLRHQAHQCVNIGNKIIRKVGRKTGEMIQDIAEHRSGDVVTIRAESTERMRSGDRSTSEHNGASECKEKGNEEFNIQGFP